MNVKISKNNSRNNCPECGGELILESYEKICQKCGLIVEKIFSESSYSFDICEPRGNFSRQYVALGQRTNFVGGLGSFIDYENSKVLKDKYGKALSPNEQRLFKRLKKNYSQFIRIKNHETEYRILNILNKVAPYLNLNKNIKKNAAYFYKKIVKSEKKVINNISLIAFCIFYAARNENHNAPITINEISNAFQNFGHRVNPRLILRDGLKYKCHLKNYVKPHKSEHYITRLINDVVNNDNLKARLKKKGSDWSIMEFKNNLTIKSREILENLSSWNRGGRNPFILAGAIIYLADKLLAKDFKKKSILTQKIVSEATKIAEYSIRDHYVTLLKPIFINNK